MTRNHARLVFAIAFPPLFMLFRWFLLHRYNSAIRTLVYMVHHEYTAVNCLKENKVLGFLNATI